MRTLYLMRPRSIECILRSICVRVLGCTVVLEREEMKKRENERGKKREEGQRSLKTERESERKTQRNKKKEK